jgi:hypothetical protein
MMRSLRSLLLTGILAIVPLCIPVGPAQAGLPGCTAFGVTPVISGMSPSGFFVATHGGIKCATRVARIRLWVGLVEEHTGTPGSTSRTCLGDREMRTQRCVDSILVFELCSCGQGPRPLAFRTYVSGTVTYLNGRKQIVPIQQVGGTVRCTC